MILSCLQLSNLASHFYGLPVSGIMHEFVGYDRVYIYGKRSIELFYQHLYDDYKSLIKYEVIFVKKPKQSDENHQIPDDVHAISNEIITYTGFKFDHTKSKLFASYYKITPEVNDLLESCELVGVGGYNGSVRVYNLTHDDEMALTMLTGDCDFVAEVPMMTPEMLKINYPQMSKFHDVIEFIM